MVRELSDEAERLVPVRPQKGRTRLMTTLQKESLNESLGKIPEFDDVVWVMGTMDQSTITPQQSFAYNRLFIPRLNRVRKILDESRNSANPPLARLKEMLVAATDGFEEVDKAWNHELAFSPTGGVSRDAPNEYDKRTLNATAATYLLEELGAFDALPVMAKLYVSEKKIPVDRLYLFYAAHLLATQHPRSGLSSEAAKALDNYLRASEKLPRPEEVKVPSWRSLYEETDWRIVIGGQDLRLENQPQMNLRVYPSELAAMENLDGVLDKTVDDLFKRLNRFIELAYP